MTVCENFVVITANNFLLNIYSKDLKRCHLSQRSYYLPQVVLHIHVLRGHFDQILELYLNCVIIIVAMTVELRQYSPGGALVRTEGQH